MYLEQAQVARADFEQLLRARWKIIRNEILKNYFSLGNVASVHQCPVARDALTLPRKVQEAREAVDPVPFSQLRGCTTTHPQLPQGVADIPPSPVSFYGSGFCRGVATRRCHL